MSTENLVTGKYYRILKDKVNHIYDRISFWTHSDDVETSSGATLTSDLSAKDTKISSTQSDFGSVETSSVSSHAYVKGNLLLYNNQLYRAKTAIAVGATLTVGSNIEAVTVGTLSNMLTASNGNQFNFDVKDGTPGFYPSASKTASEFVPFGGTALIPPNKGIVISNLNDMGTNSVDFSSGSLTITNSKAQMVSVVLNVKNWNKIKTNNDGLYSCKGFNTIDSMTSITVSYGSYTDISAYDYIAFYSTNNVITFTT